MTGSKYYYSFSGEVPCLRMSRFSKMRWHLVQFDHNNYTYVHFYHLFQRRTEVSCVIFFWFLKTKMLEIFFTVRNVGHWVATYHMLYFYSYKMQENVKNWLCSQNDSSRGSFHFYNVPPIKDHQNFIKQFVTKGKGKRAPQIKQITFPTCASFKTN